MGTRVRGAGFWGTRYGVAGTGYEGLGVGGWDNHDEMMIAEQLHAIRCDYDGLKMAEVENGHLILRTKHHGETHVKIVALEALVKNRT